MSKRSHSLSPASGAYLTKLYTVQLDYALTFTLLGAAPPERRRPISRIIKTISRIIRSLHPIPLGVCSLHAMMLSIADKADRLADLLLTGTLDEIAEQLEAIEPLITALPALIADSY